MCSIARRSPSSIQSAASPEQLAAHPRVAGAVHRFFHPCQDLPGRGNPHPVQQVVHVGQPVAKAFLSTEFLRSQGRRLAQKHPGLNGVGREASELMQRIRRGLVDSRRLQQSQGEFAPKQGRALDGERRIRSGCALHDTVRRPSGLSMSMRSFASGAVGDRLEPAR